VSVLLHPAGHESANGVLQPAHPLHDLCDRGSLGTLQHGDHPSVEAGSATALAAGGSRLCATREAYSVRPQSIFSARKESQMKAIALSVKSSAAPPTTVPARAPRLPPMSAPPAATPVAPIAVFLIRRFLYGSALTLGRGSLRHPLSFLRSSEAPQIVRPS
jgi:hypothetical protein